MVRLISLWFGVWLRYIDDVFFIWTHGQSKLDSFLEYLNEFHQTIKFTSESSMEKVSFLDVMVVKKGGILETDLYCKPTDTHQYLQRGSCHPWHVKKAIPYGQALRIRRICSDDGKFWLGRRNWLVGLRIEVMMRALLRSRLKGLGIWTGKC